MMFYNKDLRCVEVVQPNGIFRRFNDGRCLFKDKNGLEDKFEAAPGVTVKDYTKKLKEFTDKHGVDLDTLMEFTRSNRDIINKDRTTL